MCTVQFDRLLILVFTQLESAMACLLSLTVDMTVIQLIYSTCQVACTVRFVSECIVHIRQGGHQGGNHNCHLPSCWCWCWWTHLRREAGEAHLVRQSQTSSQVPLLLWFTCSWEVWASELQSRRRDQAMDLWSPPVLCSCAWVHWVEKVVHWVEKPARLRFINAVLIVPRCWGKQASLSYSYQVAQPAGLSGFLVGWSCDLLK